MIQFGLRNLPLCVLIIVIGLSACNTSKTIDPETIDFESNWMLFSSADVEVSGDKISSTKFKHEDGHETNVPNTVLAALVDNEVYKDIHFSDNFDKIPKEPFAVPWWYRKEINLQNISKDEVYRLIFEGINYRANVWLNGQHIASSDTMEGCFRIFDFDVTDYMRSGKNILAVEVIPPKEKELTIGFVDWNPWPPDNNLGIWRPVKLVKSGMVSIKHPYVKTDIDFDKQEASLTISAELTNYANTEVMGIVRYRVINLKDEELYTPWGYVGGDLDTVRERIVEQPFVLAANQKKLVSIHPADHENLNILNPKFWWPNNLGIPSLYGLEMEVLMDSEISDHHTTRFGIREVSDYINENGHRGYIVNGDKVLIRGAGWVDDVLLSDSDRKVKAQIDYADHIGLNTIRLEGFWGRNKTIYEYADEMGIMLMIGWSCQWEWEGYCGRKEDDTYMSIFSDEDIALHSRSYMDQVLWLRNHPSVSIWVYGSDKLVVPRMEKKLNDFIAAEDGMRPILNSCKSNVSEITGHSAVKMLGPYAYVTPNYWYEDTNLGGAYGFNTETGPGIQPSPLVSLKKMIPEESLWPINDIWRYHLGRNEFSKFDRWLPAFNKRYGEEDNVEDFAFKAQMSNYEAMRAMFEAFSINKHNATGVIQWMFNSAMPGMLWQLFDWYLIPNGAFYGAKTSCGPFNLVYNYKDESVHIVNETRSPGKDLIAEIRVFDMNSRELFNKSVTFSFGENMSRKIYEIPYINNLTSTYFLDLRLKRSDGHLLKNNFYWLSTKKDVLDFKNSEWFYTPNKSYADFSALNSMDEASIDVEHNYGEVSQSGNEFSTIWTSLTNTSEKIAFFIELSVNDGHTGELVVPVFWFDNYISLLPGETRTVEGYWYKDDLKGTPQFSYKGWNVR